MLKHRHVDGCCCQHVCWPSRRQGPGGRAQGSAPDGDPPGVVGAAGPYAVQPKRRLAQVHVTLGIQRGRHHWVSLQVARQQGWLVPTARLARHGEAGERGAIPLAASRPSPQPCLAVGPARHGLGYVKGQRACSKAEMNDGLASCQSHAALQAVHRRRRRLRLPSRRRHWHANQHTHPSSAPTGPRPAPCGTRAQSGRSAAP